MFPDRETANLNRMQEPPAYFRDLNLDQIIENIILGRQEYNIKPFFLTPLRSENIILYRQEVMRDLEREVIFNSIKTFADRIFEVASRAQKIYKNIANPESYNCNYLEKGKFLDSASIYCETINTLVSDMPSFDLKSRGLLAFREYVLNYQKSDAFKTLYAETNTMKTGLSTVRYCMLIKNNFIKVRKYENETDVTPEIEKIFHKFRQGAVKDYRQKLIEEPYAEHVEAGVLNLVAKLYPELFSKLDSFCNRNKDFIDEIIYFFSQEIQFYIAYLEYMEKFKRVGLHFCYPQISAQDKEIHNFEGFDLALADKLLSQNSPVVCNDFYLKDRERIIVVSGPNQGGKTTFARVFGQLHHLASIGCPVPGIKARLFLFDRIFTHFPREEDVQNLRGKLQDDLIRMHNILNQATSDSIIIINEFLSSATLKDALSIMKKILDRIIQLDLLCICVTFLDEISLYDEKIVSMVSTVSPDDPVLRTYKIIRSPADGLAYAMHIAQKYRLTYDCLKERIKL